MNAKSGCNSESGMSIIEVMILAVVISMLMIVMTESLTTMSSVRMEQRLTSALVMLPTMLRAASRLM